MPDMLHSFTSDRSLFHRYFARRDFKASGRLLNIFGISMLDVYSANIVSSQGEINCTPTIGTRNMEDLQYLNDTYTPNQPVMVQGTINGIAFGTLMLTPCQVWEMPEPDTITPTAKQGDPEAQYQLGEIYTFGVGVPADIKTGRDWYQRAAKQGHAQAAAAIKLLAEREDMESYKAAQDRLAVLVEQEQKRIASYATASLDQLYQTAKDGDSEAQMNIGKRYLAGEGVDPDEHLGVDYLSRAAAQRNPRAISALQEAATPGLLSNGSAEAAFALGRLYQAGKGPASDAAALAWFRIAAKQDYPGARELVKIYDAKVLDALDKAAETGNPVASLILAKRYLEPDNGTGKGQTQAIPLLIQAAGRGSTDALALLEEQAQPGWFSFSDGNADAAFALGELYLKGIGVSADPAEASRWYGIAAKKGVQAAKVRLQELQRTQPAPP
jgi:TPR repeat protein